MNGAISSVASSPTPTAYARRPARLAGIVRGSVIMKKRKTRISGDDTSVHQNSAPSIGPTCQAAVIVCPLAASTPIPAAKASQKPDRDPVRCRRPRITKPPATMSASASTRAGESGPHQNASGSARSGPSSRKHGTRPKFDGLKTWRPRNVIRYFESSATAEVAAKIHQPCMLHQSPCSVPGTRRMNATPFPVSSALAGHMITLCLRNVIATSSTAAVRSETRIWAIDRLKPNEVCPRTCNVMMTAARCRRGSRAVGSRIGYRLPRICSDGRPARAGALIGVHATAARGNARVGDRRRTGFEGSSGEYARVAVPATRYDALIAELRAALPAGEAPPDFDSYLDKVRRHAYEITDDEVQALKQAGHSEDEIFEHTVSAAAQAGLERLDAGLRALL